MNKLRIKFLKDEKWFGGAIDDGIFMPYSSDFAEVNMNETNKGNQITSLFISTEGRYVYSDFPFTYSIKKNNIFLTSEKELKLNEGFKDLKGAYLDLASHHFKLDKKHPNMDMFSLPQYNTWIEMKYDCNEKKVLSYAEEIIANGFKPGVIMLDDSWQTDYGIWDFNPNSFKNPKGMIEKLHSMGFKVMLWVCPFISPDSVLFREIETLNYMIKDENNNTKVVRWWDGFSAVYDFTNPKAVAFFKKQLDGLKEKYKVDGFKFDAADIDFYVNATFDKAVDPAEQCRIYSEIAACYDFNEIRACYNMQGKGIAQRLTDKKHTWNNRGLNTLIPNGIAASILGYSFVCPDMIGGGLIGDFTIKGFKLDEELFVRYAQVAAYFPMMQFSLAPWKVLSEKNLAIVKECVKKHEAIFPYIEELINRATKTGEPILRPICYEYPHQGFESVTDAFMLGDRYIIVPMVYKGKNHRLFKLPAGDWKDEEGNIFSGNKNVSILVPIDRIPVFEKYEKVLVAEEKPSSRKKSKKSSKTIDQLELEEI